ncbi:PQQ-binding-like beta-propeller repeat protein, partial [bacterium]|nr:PQQ-binding-like beta-propeller repeat protein [bacterium]
MWIIAARADGTIYVGSRDGKLYAIGPGEGM